VPPSGFQMLRIIDRYVIREILSPFVLGLFVFTFLLMIPPIMDVAEELIAKGVDGVTIVKIMVTLLPQGLGITIPMAMLLGVLMGLGRLSSDRETVALQACGVSIFRMMTPLLLIGLMAAAATGWIMIVALPDANQAFREITFRTVANRAEGEVKERVFFQNFPNVMLYVREVSPNNGGWADVFLADTRNSEHPDIYIAERGQVSLNREERRVDIILHNGSGHRVSDQDPEAYEVQEFEELVIALDADAVFPRTGPQRGLRELSVPQLQAEVVRMKESGLSPHRPIMELHRKFSIPVACLVFALLGLGLGVTSRKDGKLASFALGIGVIFAYYVVMYMGESMAKGGLVSPHLAMWLPNIILGLAGVLLVAWRSGSVERRISVPFLSRHPAAVASESTRAAGTERAPHIDRAHAAGAFSVPRLGMFRLNLLDWYVARLYSAILALGFFGLLGIFYISTFIDLSDKLFKGQATGPMLLEYFWFATPQFAYYVLPISALIATLVTVGLLTKSSELTVMKACGISLYRAAVPVLLFSLVWSGVLFGLGESVLGPANRRAEALNRQIRTGSAEAFDGLNRRWLVSGDGSIYNYRYFDSERNEINRLSVFEFEGRPWRLARRTFVEQVAYTDGWQGQDIWAREFAESGAPPPFERHATAALPTLESPDFFETERPDTELMSYGELERYIEDLSASGFDVVDLVVALHRKASFPFVTLVLTLIAIPFAVTTGPRGALYGVGVGISIACGYWIILSVFGAVGAAGLLAPSLAAWAPNILFGASAGYMLLTVRT
jgi:LPS export ABC transporter permease LptF/LPS export ABC transporter permease LptG